MVRTYTDRHGLKYLLQELLEVDISVNDLILIQVDMQIQIVLLFQRLHFRL